MRVKTSRLYLKRHRQLFVQFQQLGWGINANPEGAGFFEQAEAVQGSSNVGNIFRRFFQCLENLSDTVRRNVPQEKQCDVKGFGVGPFDAQAGRRERLFEFALNADEFGERRIIRTGGHEGPDRFSR